MDRGVSIVLLLLLLLLPLGWDLVEYGAASKSSDFFRDFIHYPRFAPLGPPGHTTRRHLGGLGSLPMIFSGSSGGLRLALGYPPMSASARHLLHSELDAFGLERRWLILHSQRCLQVSMSLAGSSQKARSCLASLVLDRLSRRSRKVMEQVGELVEWHDATWPTPPTPSRASLVTVFTPEVPLDSSGGCDPAVSTLLQILQRYFAFSRAIVTLELLAETPYCIVL